jgi:hypothetical protein
VRVEDVRNKTIVVRPPQTPDFVGEEGEVSRSLRESEEYRDIFTILQGLLGITPGSLENSSKVGR